MRRFLLLVAVTVIAPITLCAGACGGDGAPSGPPSSSLDLEDVVYEGGTTDEALVALLSASPKSDPTQAAVFLNPMDGASFPSDPAPKLAWRIGGATGRLKPPASRGGARIGSSAPAGRAAPSALRRLLSAVPTARAHGAPINGRAYFLVFSAADGEAALRVFTTRLDYTPDAAAWTKLRGVGGTITVTALNAVFETNRVAVGEAPFEGEPVGFAIQP